MRRTIKLLVLAAALAVFAVPAIAQTDQCTDENKDLWYAKTFLPNFKGNEAQQKTAYEAAKKYIANCPADQYSDYMQKKFVEPYEKIHANLDVAKQFQDAITGKNYAEQMRLGKQILVNDPDNVDVNVVLGIAGLGDANLLNDSAQYARKAISLLESGKTTKIYSNDQALAYLNWTVGKSNVTRAPADAITSLLKAARFQTPVNKNAQLYIDLAAAYENGPRAKLSEEYKAAQGPDGTETPQSKLVLENLNKVIDNQIDALARAAALADAANKKDIMDSVSELYKYRNKTASDADINQLIASVLSKPIPDVPTPVTSLPTTPGSTPGTSGGTNGGSGTNNGGNGKPASTTSGTSTTTGVRTGSVTGTTTTQTGTAKPTPTPSPRKPLKYRRG